MVEIQKSYWNDLAEKGRHDAELKRDLQELHNEICVFK
jgi:hypothetical protein